MKKIVAFDLDGTLLDSADDLLLALNILLKEIELKEVDKKEIKFLVSNGAKAMIKKALEINNVNSNNIEKFTIRFLEIYRTCFLNNSKLFPYAIETLNKLKLKSFILVLVSNKPEFFVNKILDHFKISNLFSAISGGDTFNVKKPDPKHLLETIKYLGIEKYQCTFVGDSISDALCAKRSNSDLILMSYGYSSENIHDMGADIILDCLSKIPNFLKF